VKGFAVLPLIRFLALFISGDGLFPRHGAAAPGKRPPGGGQQRPQLQIIAGRNGDKTFDNLASGLAGKPDEVLFDLIVQFTLCPRSVRSES